MFTILHVLAGVLQAILAVIGTRHFITRHRSWYGLIVVAIAWGLAYDNFAIAAGAILPEGDALKAVNAPRFYIHALLTPLLVIFAFGVARRAGLAWAQSRVAHAIACVLATALLALGAYVDVLNLRLEPARFQDVLRYVNGYEFLKGPPIPALVTIMFTLAVGVLVWARTRWPWLAAGSLLMLLAAGAGARLVTLANYGEIVLVGASVATFIVLGRRIGAPAAQVAGRS